MGNEITAFEGRPAKLADLRRGLKVTTVARGFGYPTDFAFLPDGHVLVAEKAGIIQIVSPRGVVATRPFLDLRRQLDTRFFRGIVGLAVDPDFASHPYVYVAYTPRLGGLNSVKSTVVRISRIKVVGDAVDDESEQVIVGKDDTRPCEDQPISADCLPAQLDVVGTDFAFAPDGTMFISTGYGGGFERVEKSAILAQNVNTLGGKILHIDRDGRGLRDNPFWNGDPNANRSKVWAYGFRNPFRMAFLPGSPTTLAVGDVGLDNWESLLRVTRGRNYGWPCYEGNARTPLFEHAAYCRSFYRSHPATPSASWLALPHPKFATIIAGTSLATLRPCRRPTPRLRLRRLGERGTSSRFRAIDDESAPDRSGARRRWTGPIPDWPGRRALLPGGQRRPAAPHRSRLEAAG